MARTAGMQNTMMPTPKYNTVAPDTRAAPVFSTILLMSISSITSFKHRIGVVLKMRENRCSNNQRARDSEFRERKDFTMLAQTTRK